MQRDAIKRRLFRKFYEGDHYWFQNGTGGLTFQATGMTGVAGANKANYRIRNTYNWVRMVVDTKTSAATQRIPGYEVTPSTDDPDDQAAARLASQVATYGYDQWRIRRRSTKAVNTALVEREGFRSDVGAGRRLRGQPLARDRADAPQRGGRGDPRLPARDDPDAGGAADRRVAFAVGAHHRVPRAAVPEVPEGPPRLPRERPGLRRPSPGPGPEPGWTDWWEPYPYLDADGVVQDDPVIHRISYTVNPDDKKGDLGLVERIIDLQRTINDCWNKILEMKNRALMLQMLAPYGADMQRRDDNPGSVLYYKGPNAPTWEPAPDPQLSVAASADHAGRRPAASRPRGRH
jgi:hypothetical protein